MPDRCRGCGELKQFTNLNSEGECESCSVICEQCSLPSRIVGDVDEESKLCFDCKAGVNKKINERTKMGSKTLAKINSMLLSMEDMMGDLRLETDSPDVDDLENQIQELTGLTQEMLDDEEEEEK